MRILVTGATGFIGYEVARLLAAQGRRPRLVVRRPERGLLLNRLDAELVQGDLLSRDSLRKATEGVDAIIHLGARATFEDYRLLRPTIVDGSAALMEAAAEAGVSRVAYGSSMLVYAGQAESIDSSTLADPQVAYGRAKLEAEESMARLAQESGIDLMSLRLPHVYGARDLLFSRISKRAVLIPGRKMNLFSHLHVADAARALVAAVDGSGSATLPIADLRATTWPDFFDIIRAHFPRLRVVRMPEQLALTGTRLLHPGQLLSGKQTIFTTDSVVGWNTNLVIDPRPGWERLGTEPEYPTAAEGIPAALDECVSFRWLHPVDDKRFR